MKYFPAGWMILNICIQLTIKRYYHQKAQPISSQSEGLFFTDRKTRTGS